MAGESADAGIDKAEDFIFNVLPRLIEGWKIFTMLMEKDFSLNAYRTKYTGLGTRSETAEKSKDRLTVMVFCNLTGNDKVEHCFRRGF
jgi:hypothetical protein